MSRELLNDKQLVEFISENFISVAAGVEQLFPSRYGYPETAASRWFVAMASEAFKNSEWAPAGWWENFKTYQGLYVADIHGRPYLYKIAWELKPSEVLDDLRTALKAQRTAAKNPIEISGEEIAEASLLQPPPGTSVVRVFTRLAPLPKDATASERSIGRDIMWILKEEVSEIVDRASGIGPWTAMPKTLTARMLRFHLINHVGNVGIAFDEDDVKKAQFRLRQREKRDGRSTYEFSGIFDSRHKSVSESVWAGEGAAQGQIEGTFEVDTRENRIIKFSALGRGTVTAGNQSMRRGRSYAIKFAMTEGDNHQSSMVPPIGYAISPQFHSVYLHPKLSLND